MDPLVLPAWLTLLIVVLASARIWRLLTVDGITFPLRRAWANLVGRIAGGTEDTARRRFAETLDEGFYCAFCSGFWVALATLSSALAWSDTLAWQLVAIPLAVNWVAGHANSRVEADDFDPQPIEYDA